MSKVINRLLAVALLMVLAWVFYIFADANLYHYTANMESDTASETLLAKVLYENGHTQPSTWQMSTGRRIIASPMLASFLYPVTAFDLNAAMGLATTLMVVALVGAMLFFNRQIGLSFLESMVAILLTFVLATPESEIQRHIFLYAAYYTGHFICMFLVLGIYARALKKDKLPLIGIIVTVPLAIVNGMQGMHASMFFYMPLLGAEILRVIALFIKKKKINYKITSWVAIISLGSVVSFKVFGTHMVSDVSRNIRHAPEKFFDIVLPFCKSVLWYDRYPLLIALFVILAVLGYVLAITRLKDKPELWSALPIPFGVVVVILSTTFTTAESAPRYYMMQIFIVGVGTALLIHLFKPEKTMCLALLVVFYGITSAMAFDEALVKGDQMAFSAYEKVIAYMEENGYEYGYSVFDYANMITVISNDKVKVRPVNSFAEMEGVKWLSDSTWYPPYKDPNGLTCYVVSEPKKEDFNDFVKKQAPLIIDSKELGVFTVYVTDRDYTVWVD
ncbi:MAG: hypothetical protein E7305_11120 [Butyrivibrio sp.]|nr:hypothetical protein [Butyrivibrio sp.]